MTKENLKKGIEIDSLLKNEIHSLTNIEQVEIGLIGTYLLSLMERDKIFKESFNKLIESTKLRLEYVFEEL